MPEPILDPNGENTFNPVYWRARPPQVRVLQTFPMDTPAGPEFPRSDLVYKLAAQGFIMDKAIDLYGMGPYTTMFLRLNVDQESEGLDLLGATEIKYSVTPSDYPPFPDPEPPVDPVTEYIGEEIGSTIPWVGSYWFATQKAINNTNGGLYPQVANTLQMVCNDGKMHTFSFVKIMQNGPLPGQTQNIFRWLMTA